MENPQGTLPRTSTRVAEGELELPEFYDRVMTLADVVPVEYYVPGCPPVRDQILALVDALATGKLPPVGAVIAADHALCDDCPRPRQKEKKLDHIYRPHQIEPDPQRCLLEQGILCMGPVTRGGCGSRCIKVNMPCRGCFGPAPGVYDQGAKMVSAIGSIYQADDEVAIGRMLEEVADPAGTFYRFTLSSSFILPKAPAAAKEAA
jgi:F420-non-reducing hydrogenase small subunit